MGMINNNTESLDFDILSYNCDTAKPFTKIKKHEKLVRELNSEYTLSSYYENKTLINQFKSPIINKEFKNIEYMYKQRYYGEEEINEYFNQLKPYIDDLMLELDIKRWRTRYRIDQRKHLYQNYKSYIEQQFVWDVIGLTVEFKQKPSWYYLASFENIMSLEKEELLTSMSTKLKNIESFIDAAKLESGKYSVIMGPQLASVFWHECIGHMMEADYKIQKRQQFYEKLITLPQINIFDKMIPGRGGVFYKYDDEGVEKKEVCLIKNGKLLNLISDKKHSKILNIKNTGNGRYGTGYIGPRMSNLVIEDGYGKVRQWINSEKKCLYINEPKNGKFNGEKLQLECEGGTLYTSQGKKKVGPLYIEISPFEALKKIVDISSDSEWQSSGGLCNKGNSRGVIVGTKSPSILLNDLYCCSK